jgi:hypothetical protein
MRVYLPGGLRLGGCKRVRAATQLNEMRANVQAAIPLPACRTPRGQELAEITIDKHIQARWILRKFRRTSQFPSDWSVYSFYEKADRCQGTLLGLLLVP